MLRTTRSWNGESEELSVEDTDGGTWYPNDEAQAEIQSSQNKSDKAIEICQSEPMRGRWSV